MINTYQTSLAPPPVPPRLSRSQPILIPASLPSQGHSKPLIRFLVGVVVLHLLLSVAAFIYLYNKNQKVSYNQPEEKDAYFSSQRKDTSYKALAHMVVYQPKTLPKNTSGYLQWDIKHSVRKNINYYHNSWLTVLQPGDYYVYSKVTFSKGDREHPLASSIKLRKAETGEEEVVMRAYCSLDSAPSIPRMCTATQGELITLEQGNQLSVWVQDLSQVDYEGIATSFGMYKV